MRRKSNLLVVYPCWCGIVVLAACGRTDPNDPVEVKRRFIQTVNGAIKIAEPGLKKPFTRSGFDDKPHTYSAEYTGKFTYDITKTDSIVTPYMGTVNWVIRWYHNSVQTDTPMTLEAHYAYQGGRWLIKDLVRNAGHENQPSPLKNMPAEEYYPLFGLPTASY